METEKKKEESKVVKTFSPLNDKGELDLKKLIVYAVLLVVGGGTGGGMFVGSIRPDIERQHKEAMEVLREIRDEIKESNVGLKLLKEGQIRHEKESEKHEGRMMKKLDDIHRDVRK